MVLVVAQLRPDVLPRLPKLLEHSGVFIANGNKLGVWMAMVGCRMGARAGYEWMLSRARCANTGQAYDRRAVRLHGSIFGKVLASADALASGH